MKETLIKTLDKLIIILETLHDAQYTDKSVPPFHSSVGGHVRHILNFYDAIIAGVMTKEINLINRKRDSLTEVSTTEALKHVNHVKLELKGLPETYEAYVTVIDDLGNGNMKVPYTLGGILSHANSHAIHHYAIISYILNAKCICVADSSFGYNPSTPINANVGNA